jgi:hypothetical protein
MLAILRRGAYRSRRRMRPGPTQFAELYARLRPCLGRLSRLRARLIAIGYRPDDPYLLAVDAAWSAVHELCVRTHYLSCEGGVGGANVTGQET